MHKTVVKRAVRYIKRCRTEVRIFMRPGWVFIYHLPDFTQYFILNVLFYFPSLYFLIYGMIKREYQNPLC